MARALVGVDDVLQDPCHWGGEGGDLVGGDALDGDDLYVVAPGVRDAATPDSWGAVVGKPSTR